MNSGLTLKHAERSLLLEVNPVLGTRKDKGLACLETDLLVVTAIQGYWNASPNMVALDEALEGRLTKAISASEFDGSEGSQVLASGITGGAKQVLVLGIGAPDVLCGTVLCETIARAVSVAAQLGSKGMTVAIMPYRAGGEKLNLKGTAATLRCRLQLMLEENLTGRLERITLMSTPQAGRFLTGGISVSGTRCSECPFKSRCT